MLRGKECNFFISIATYYGFYYEDLNHYIHNEGRSLVFEDEYADITLADGKGNTICIPWNYYAFVGLLHKHIHVDIGEYYEHR